MATPQEIEVIKKAIKKLKNADNVFNVFYVIGLLKALVETNEKTLL